MEGKKTDFPYDRFISSPLEWLGHKFVNTVFINPDMYIVNM